MARFIDMRSRGNIGSLCDSSSYLPTFQVGIYGLYAEGAVLSIGRPEIFLKGGNRLPPCGVTDDSLHTYVLFRQAMDLQQLQDLLSSGGQRHAALTGVRLIALVVEMQQRDVVIQPDEPFLLEQQNGIAVFLLVRQIPRTHS